MSKDDIRALRNAYAIAVEDNKILKEKLEKIKEMCIYDCQYECSNNSDDCDICSCLEQRIIRLIEGAEDEN